MRVIYCSYIVCFLCICFSYITVMFSYFYFIWKVLVMVDGCVFFLWLSRWFSDPVSADAVSGGDSSLLYGAGHRSEDASGQHRRMDGHQPVSGWTGLVTLYLPVVSCYKMTWYHHYMIICALQVLPVLWPPCTYVCTTTSSTPGASGISSIHFRSVYWKI